MTVNKQNKHKIDCKPIINEPNMSKFTATQGNHITEDHKFVYLGFPDTLDLKETFHDVRFVCMGGSAKRMKGFIGSVAKQLSLQHLLPQFWDFAPIGKSDRYHIYKLGPVLAVNHGMGMASLMVLLHELTTVLFLAGAKDFCYIRIGTSGGLGTVPGTVVVTEESLNSEMLPEYETFRLGKRVAYPSRFNARLVEDLYSCRGDGISALVGKTVATDDFYEEQGRLDGFFAGSAQDRQGFLQRAHQAGARNIEMEGLALAAFCTRAEIPAAMVCTTLLDRLQGDQVTATPEQLTQYADNAIALVLRYLKKKHLNA